MIRPYLRIQRGTPPEAVVKEETLHFSVDCAFVGSDSWRARAMWSSLRGLQNWFLGEFNVTPYIGKGRHVTTTLQDSSMGHEFQNGDYHYPTLFFMDQARLTGNHLGLAQGEFATIAQMDSRWIEVAKHELGHLLGLQHNEASFMHPFIEQSHLLPVLPEEREIVRRYVERYCR